MKKQVNTSKNTSINNSKLPTAYKDFKPNIKGCHVCDYGCGKYTSHIRDYVCENGGLSYNPYDPYNMPELENYITRETGEVHGYDLIMCCNVLNVIDSDDVISNIIIDMLSWLRTGGMIVIQIYEGNKSGVGVVTKSDCYQRNCKTENYLNIFPVLPEKYSVERHGNYITISDRKTLPIIE